MTERNTMEELTARARAIIEDVRKALQGLDEVSKGYSSMGAKVSEEAKQRVLVGCIKDQLVMAYNMGVVNTEARIYGAPWEFLFQSISPSANENEGEANMSASLGWEYLACDGRWIIWRRRKVEGLSTIKEAQ